MIKKTVFAAAFVFLGFLAAPSNLFACSCSFQRPPTVLDAFEDSELVFTAKLVASKKTIIDYHEARLITAVVQKVYKGKIKAASELIYIEGNDVNCGLILKGEIIGAEYLFYADELSAPLEPENDRRSSFTASFCSRSALLKSAFDDLSYLNNLKAAQGRTRVSGRVHAVYQDAPVFANLRITLAGEGKRYSTRTDKNGFFEIYDLPADTYIVTLVPPKGNQISESGGVRFTAKPYDVHLGALVNDQNQIKISLLPNRHSGLYILLERKAPVKSK